MATGSPKIKVVVTGDATGFDRAMKGAAGKINGFGGSLRRVFNERIINAGFNALERGIRAVFDFLPKATDNADAFGDSLALIESHAAGLSGVIADLDLSKLGFSKLDTAGAAQDIAAVGKSLGLTDKRLKTLVPNLTELAAGYASLTGKDPATAAGLFAKALAGNGKAAKTLGVSFKKGSTPLERYAILMKKFKPLVKDVTDGTRELADEQATFQANLSDLTTNAGLFLSTALAPIVAFINNDLIPAFKAWWGQHGQKVLDWLGDVGRAVGGFITSKGFKDFIGLVGDITRNLIDFAAANGPGFIDFVSKVGSAVVNWASTTGKDIVLFIGGVVSTVAQWAGDTGFAQFVLDVVTNVANWVAAQGEAMSKFIRETSGDVSGFPTDKGDEFNKFLEDAGKFAGDAGDAIKWLDEQLDPLGDAISALVVGALGLFVDTLTGLADVAFKLAGFLGDVNTALQNVSRFISNTAKKVWDDLAKAVGEVLDNVQRLIDLLPKLKFPSLPGIGGIPFPNPFAGPSIAPFAATGGALTPLAATRLGGAAAAPGGITINVRTGVGDPVAIGRQVAQVLNAYQRRGGTI